MTLETSGPRSYFQNLVAVRTALPLCTDPRQVILSLCTWFLPSSLCHLLWAHSILWALSAKDQRAGWAWGGPAQTARLTSQRVAFPPFTWREAMESALGFLVLV